VAARYKHGTPNGVLASHPPHPIHMELLTEFSGVWTFQVRKSFILLTDVYVCYGILSIEIAARLGCQREDAVYGKR
jgi:hypothetical protein